MGEIDEKVVAVKTSFVWPSKLIQEVAEIFNNSFESDDSNDPKFDSKKFTDSIMQILFVRSNTLMKESFKQSVETLFTKKDVNLDRCIQFLEPYVKNCIDFGRMNSISRSKVGLDSIVLQFEKFYLKRGVDFNIIVVGKAGLGKSTLIDTIFKSDICRRHHDFTDSDDSINGKKCSTKSTYHVLVEDGYRVKLCIVDTPGFGDSINNNDCWEVIYKCIESRLQNHMTKETETTRDLVDIDSRIHCCMYFISPTGHRLSALDIALLQRLNGMVNIIPVIGRADSLTKDELASFKTRVRQDLMNHKIKVFPDTIFTIDDDPSYQKNYQQIIQSIPLAVVGANVFGDSKTNFALLRKTPYGEVQIENPDHCDFNMLMDILIRKDMLSLIHTTDKIFYENYRRSVLLQNK